MSRIFSRKLSCHFSFENLKVNVFRKVFNSMDKNPR